MKWKNVVIGIIVGGIVVAPTTYLITKASIDSRLINYSNSNTTQYGATKENVQEAIDELYAKGQAKLASVQNGTHIYADGEIVYFDPVNNTTCSNWSSSNSATNTRTGCLRWFVYLDDGSDTVKLLLDHNTTAAVQWYTSETYVTYDNSRAKQEIEALISSSGSNWKVSSNDSSIAIKSIGFIEASDVARITGNTGWDSTTSSSFYFDTKTTSSPRTYGAYWWLYDRTYSCRSYGCVTQDQSSYTNASSGSKYSNYGYWTSTYSGRYSKMWVVSYLAYFNNYVNVNDNNYGVRPVVTILRSKL